MIEIKLDGKTFPVRATMRAWKRFEDNTGKMGLGQVRLNPVLLYDLTFSEFGNAMRGHYKQIEEREKADWERTRWLAAIVVNPHVKKRITPKDLATFPWEQKEKAADGFSILRSLAN
jgi:hypothetical protein